jgi:Ca-activated chloride channel family protein
MSFESPRMLWVAVLGAAAVMALWAYDRVRRRQLTSRIGELPIVRRVIASASPGRRLVKAIVTALGVALVGFSLARPQIAGKRNVELRGLDLVVAVDVSKSMMVSDVGQTEAMADKHIAASRLARARELAGALIDELPGDRIAPVVFAGAAAHFPLTEDHEVATEFLYDLGPADLAFGSNLAEVFRVSRCLLRPDLYDDLGCSRIGRRGHGGDALPGESLDPASADDKRAEPIEKTERGKAIVMFTDGGDPDPEAQREIATARELGIAVIIVGVGTPEGGVVHEIDADGNATDQPKKLGDGTDVISKRDDEGMRALVQTAGDPTRYVIASATGEVDPSPIVQLLSGVSRGLATKKIEEKHDIFQPFLFAAFCLFVIEVAISTRRRRATPEDLT